MNTVVHLAISLLCLIPMKNLNAQNYEIYVSDAANFNNPPWKILKYDQNGQNPQVFITDSLAWPQDIVFLENSNEVLISNLNSGKINLHDATTGAFIEVFADSIGGPTRMKFGPDGYLYVLQWGGNGKVLRYDVNSGFVDEFTSTGVTKSIGFDWDPSGNLYVSSFSDDLVQKFDASGINQGTFVNSNLVGPTNIWFDTNGDLLVSDYLGGAVKRFDTTGTFIANFITGLSNSEGIYRLSNGDLLIGDGGTASVKMFDSTGVFLQDIVSSGSGGLQTPNAVVVRYDSELSVDENEKDASLVVKVIGTDTFLLSLENVESSVKFTILNALGSLVFEKEASTEVHWDASKVAAGTYLLRVHSAEQIINRKIVVKH